jgi:ABC-type multidrug transport system ATPase subunit
LTTRTWDLYAYMLAQCGGMAGSTRVLVTNALHVLPRCDYIYVCNGGTIAEQGTYDELIQQEKSLLVGMGATTSSTPTGTPRATSSAEEGGEGESKDKVVATPTEKTKEAGSLVKAEDRK